MTIKPLADRVVVEPKEAETKTASGLYIPDTAKEKPQQGTVIAVGPGTKDVEMRLRSVMLCSMANMPARRSHSKTRNTSL